MTKKAKVAQQGVDKGQIELSEDEEAFMPRQEDVEEYEVNQIDAYGNRRAEKSEDEQVEDQDP